MSFFVKMKERVMGIGLFDLSAQLAYYFLISFFPFLFFMVTLFGYLPFTSEDILGTIRMYVPSTTYLFLRSNLQQILDDNQHGLFSLSLVATIYLSSVGFYSVIRILNHVYQVEETRPFWKEWILGVLLMLGLLLAFFVLLMLSIFEGMIKERLFVLFTSTGGLMEMWIAIRWLLSSSFLFIIFLLLYTFVPNTPITFKEAMPGAFFATWIWQLGSLLFSLYVSTVHYSSIYGNLGGAVVLLSWFYLSSFVLLLGSRLNVSCRPWLCQEEGD